MASDLDGIDLGRLTAEQQAELLALLEAERAYQSQRLLFAMYPESNSIWMGESNKDIAQGSTIWARRYYKKHLEFFEAGARFRERCAMCANRVGKTLGMGGFEVGLHLTGEYPDWWPGRRFTRPVRVWAAGSTYETTRDIVQATLLGDVTEGHNKRKYVTGTGIIPGYLLGNLTWKQGVQDLVDTVKVKHKSGGWSVLGLKSYQQGRISFEGTAKDVIWLDEEPPEDIYNECLIRTATTNGIALITFTPLQGMSLVVKSFLTKKLMDEYARKAA